jgi:hypothetical protein
MSTIKNISLFIPHVFSNFTQKYVSESFSGLGDVERVDFVAKQDRDGKPFNAVYVHFKRWYNNRFAMIITKDGSVKFYHDDSEYYWIVLPNTAKKHVPGDRKPRIDLGESVKTIAQKQVCPSPQNTDDKANSDAEFEEYLELLRAPIEEWTNTPTKEAADEMADQMAEIEADMEAEDENLVSIDWRYVQTIEQENMWLHTEVAQLRMALINLDQVYQAEAAKVRAFSNVETFTDVETFTE